MEIDYDTDPLATLPLSPSAMVSTPVGDSGISTPGYREGSIDTPSRPKWKRLKKPFKELANKVLAEMRRKDVYGFFLEPVDTEEYPDYLERIGGRDKMMDLETMQNKLDDGDYNSIDEMESDFRMLIDAALTYNLPGSAPYREANKVLNHGMKHIARARPLVLTPTPSPSPQQEPTPLPDSERATPSAAPASSSAPSRPRELRPKHRIPEEMLIFPPNSLSAGAVGWNLTGGRRVRPKRMVRGREKFIGKWRDWAPDGSRDVAEMDDPHEIFEMWQTRKADKWRTVPDWPRIREEDEAWWEWDGIGGPTGQPPLPGQPRIKRPELRTRELGALEFGRFPDVEEELQQWREAEDVDPEADDMTRLEEHLRPETVPPASPELPAHLPPQTFVNVFDFDSKLSPVDYVRNMCVGGARGEAYTESVRRFMRGALDGAAERRREAGVEVADRVPELEQYVSERWHGGVMRSRLTDASYRTVEAISTAVHDAGSSKGTATTTELREDSSKTEPGTKAEATSQALATVKSAYARIALRDLTSPLNPLDLEPLLREPSDFGYVGVGGKSGVTDALTWVGAEVERLGRVQQEARELKAKEEASNMVVAEVTGATSNGETGPIEPMDVDPTPNGEAPAPAHATESRGTKRRSASVDADEPDSKRLKIDSAVSSAAATNAMPKQETATGTNGQSMEIDNVPRSDLSAGGQANVESATTAEPSIAAVQANGPALVSTNGVKAEPAVASSTPTTGIKQSEITVKAEANGPTMEAGANGGAEQATNVVPDVAPAAAQDPAPGAVNTVPTASNVVPAATNAVPAMLPNPTAAPVPGAVPTAAPAAASPAVPSATPTPTVPAPTPPTPATPATPAAPPPAAPPDDEAGLRKLRLELVALSKFYPLASLQKMAKEDAARLLPPNVRSLMSLPDPSPEK